MTRFKCLHVTAQFRYYGLDHNNATINSKRLNCNIPLNRKYVPNDYICALLFVCLQDPCFISDQEPFRESVGQKTQNSFDKNHIASQIIRDP